MDEFRLLLELHFYHVDIVSDTVISALKLYREKPELLSGDDSILENLWEEICVQTQGEESFHWDAYEATIKNFVIEEIEKLPVAVKNLISYVENVESEYAFVYSEFHTVEAIKSQILEKARIFSNSNIESYLDEDYDSEDDEDEVENEFDEEDESDEVD